MKTLNKFKMGEISVPMQINWQIGDLMEYRGKQELFTRLDQVYFERIKAGGKSHLFGTRPRGSVELLG